MAVKRPSSPQSVKKQCVHETATVRHTINTLTVRDPVTSEVMPEAPVVPVESFENDLVQHRHVQVDGVVQEQRIDRTLNTS